MAISTTVQAALAFALAWAAPSAHATIFPVTGTIAVNGSSAPLPAGGTFGDAVYDANTGTLSDGAFAFPDASTIVPIQGVGNVTVNYRFSQTNTSSAAVAADGVAAMTVVHAKLQILSTSPPLPVTPCVFEPIDLELAGTGSASGLDLADASFTVPPTASSCGGFASQINAALAGSNNSLTVHISGNFTPPMPDDDTIFADGFDDN
ncbi:hypothetical protein [Dokdonella fugitiva]|uniref:Uncharacterized protein n=1 Tax=Dokdonella fugitiva TaxID=328517 RepID=A0A4V2S227_9GAMM|nr:hypothetical protein [Dokdonella fugitiva]TCO38850.1 hypothetical protein EV148_107138 [Dokdonella fugitiva]